MKYSFYFKFLFVCLFFCTTNSLASIKDTGFDKSMGLDLSTDYKVNFKDPNFPKRINLLRNLYYNNLPSNIVEAETPKIPKIIHQVWLGGNALPPLYKYYQYKWQQFHPDWQYKLWKDKDLEEFHFDNIDLYQKARSYAERADILRYEILKKYGGVYIDTDTDCFAPIDDLIYKYEFVAPIESLAQNKKKLTIANNFIASIPNHPIINKTLELVRINWDKVENDFSLIKSRRPPSFNNLAVYRTMYPLTEAFFALVNDNTKNIIALPGSYTINVYFDNNYPIINYLSTTLFNKSFLQKKIFFTPETFAFHNYEKILSIYNKIDFEKGLFSNSLINKYLSKLPFRNKNKIAFKDIYQRNFISEIVPNINNKIPAILHIFPENNNDINIIRWENNHPDWQIIKWDNAKKEEILGKYSNIISNIKDDNIKNIITKIFILKNYGGVVVSDKLYSLTNIDEFINKNSFFTVIKKPNNFYDDLQLDDKVIGTFKAHSIIYNIYNDITNELDKNIDVNHADFYHKIDNILTDYFYKHHLLDGKNLTIPGYYFTDNYKHDNAFAFLNETK